ncbi:MAG: T9SS type A sorting domain-containing protein, partial [Candidatus Cloacimonetes bacterium]|nr:T9SS type A sorting domain-containing protein [Candidatus Cloacimonadota bacterium]
MIDALVTSSLHQNFPNPFNPSTTISFNLTAEHSEDADLMIYNIKGQQIKQYSISNNQCATAHKYSIVWDGTDDNGKSVSSGVYFYKLKAGDIDTQTRKMILMK